MYLQITTRCNLACSHCGFSCRPGAGKHASWDTLQQMVSYAVQAGEECITIGGGEPTLHPGLFDLLKLALAEGLYCDIITNGTKPNTMLRLANILDDEDYYTFCADQGANEYYLDQHIIQNPEGKLIVGISDDYFHQEVVTIDQRVRTLWNRRIANGSKHFRWHRADYQTAIAIGRAKRTGTGQLRECICPGLFANIAGELKPCGCPGAPIIGDIWQGLTDAGQAILTKMQKYDNDSDCYFNR